MSLSRVSTQTLAKTALVGGVVILGSLIWARTTIENRVRRAEFYRTAMKTLRSDPGAIRMLGEPITEHGFDVGDNEKNYVTKQEARLQVSVKGPNDKGYLFFWAEKPDEQSAWLIQRMELALKSTPGKLLLIKKEV